MARLDAGEIENAEHVSERDGENINAKRVAWYGYDSSASQWRRISVNSSGELNLG